MIDLNKKLILTSLAILAGSTSALAGPGQGQQSGGRPVSPMIEISAGSMHQSLGITTPCGVGCAVAGPGRATDTSRGGPVLRFGFKGINASELMGNNVGSHNLAFLPISVLVDLGGEPQGENFGRVAGYEGRTGRIRQVVGALVEANVNPGTGLISLRGKLARVEYNRDKGIWDWRAIDASVGIQGALRVGGATTLNLELDVGAGVGGVHLNGMEDLSAALNAAPPLDNAATFNPYAMVRGGLRSPSLRIELIASAEQRVDLTRKSKRAMFNGEELNVNSTHLNGTVEVEYTFGSRGLEQMGRRFSVFANAGMDVDTLTLSNMLFDGDDTLRTYLVLAGVRVQF